jgi:purine-binding chemotaxis protein CheW
MKEPLKHRSASNPTAVREAGERPQLVVLRLAARDYGIPAGTVVQVLRMVAIRPLPESAAWIAGVIDVRGKVIPVMDLRSRLGLPTETAGLSAHIVVVRSNNAALGLIADAVLEVLELEEGAVEPPGEVTGPSHAVLGVARSAERLIVVLDVDRLSADSVHLPLDLDPIEK